jgi:hypothetical protein
MEPKGLKMMHDHPTVYLSKQFWIDKINARKYDGYSILRSLNFGFWHIQSIKISKQEQSYLFNILIVDRDVIKTVLEKDGYSIGWLTSSRKENKWICKDKELVYIAIKSCSDYDLPFVVEKIDKVFLKDREFMETVIARNGACIERANFKIKRDKFFIKLAMKTIGNRVFEHLSTKDTLALLE